MQVEIWEAEVTATALHRKDTEAEATEVLAQGRDMVVVLETFLLAFWFATLAVVVGVFWILSTNLFNYWCT